MSRNISFTDPLSGVLLKTPKKKTKKAVRTQGTCACAPTKAQYPSGEHSPPSHAPGITIQQFNDSTSVHHHPFDHRSGANHVHVLRHRDRRFAGRSRDGADKPAAHIIYICTAVAVGSVRWSRTSTPSHGQRHGERTYLLYKAQQCPYDSPKIIVEKSCGLVWGEGMCYRGGRNPSGGR